MRNQWKSVLGLWVIGMGLGVSAPAQAASGVGPYYATPSWDQTLPASTRFIVLTNMNSEAVLDRETGLVWEKSPSGSRFTWSQAQFHCNELTVGNRNGWRLPAIQELASLLDRDPTNTSSPKLPPSHPFINVQSSVYYSATTSADSPGAAWIVQFEVPGIGFSGGKGSTFLVWCVRGGPGGELQ